MPRIASAVIICFGLMAIPSTTVAQSGGSQRPKSPVVGVTAEPLPVPSTLDGLWRQASLIVVGRLTTSSENRTLPSDLTGTEYRLEITETLKVGAASAPKEVSVVILGGSRMIKSRSVATVAAGEPKLGVGKDALFFLSYWPAATAYRPLAGGYFEGRGQVFVIPDDVKHMAEFQGRTTMPKADLIGLVKASRRELP